MNWTTLYIKGKSDFRDEVRKKLEHSDLNFMPGSVENFEEDMTHDLYWLDDRTDLRAVKEAVGAKLIWKYRLEFFASLEAFIQSGEKDKDAAEFTPEEMEMIRSMQRRSRRKKQTAQSA